MLLNTFLPAVSALPAEWKAQSSAPVFIFKDAACLIHAHSSRLVFNKGSVLFAGCQDKGRAGRKGRETVLCTQKQTLGSINCISPIPLTASAGAAIGLESI